jgi:hypothetical protein
LFGFFPAEIWNAQSDGQPYTKKQQPVDGDIEVGERGAQGQGEGDDIEERGYSPMTAEEKGHEPYHAKGNNHKGSPPPERLEVDTGVYDDEEDMDQGYGYSDEEQDNGKRNKKSKKKKGKKGKGKKGKDSPDRNNGSLFSIPWCGV